MRGAPKCRNLPVSMLKAFRHPKSLLRRRPALRSLAWRQSPKPSRREGVHHGGHRVISSSRQMHHSHAITSPRSSAEGSCLTECYLRPPNGRSCRPQAGMPELGQGELSPSSLCHQLRVKRLLFWKEHAGLNRNKRSYKAGVLNTWAPGLSHRDGFSDDSRQVWKGVPWNVPALNTVITQFQVLGKKKWFPTEETQSHNFFQRSRAPPASILFPVF